MPVEKNGKLMLTVEDLTPIVKGNGIVDGTCGGLILGNSHFDGGIKVIREYQNEKLYEIIAEFKGWEYISNPVATANEIDFLIKLNTEFKDCQDDFMDYVIPKQIRILDTRPIFEKK